ncbi:transposase [Filibacter tadaridae]
METFTMNVAELARLLSGKGLCREQIEVCRGVCFQANGQALDQAKHLNIQLKEGKKRAKALEKDFLEKEKALADAATILLL